MEDLRWDESLRTGDELVDQQHRNIHELVDYVESADDSLDELMHVLDRLMEHVDCHFLTEELLMERSGYVRDEANAHVADHHRLAAAARDTVLKFRQGELRSTKPVVEFLRTWLASHVHDYDLTFIEFVKSREMVAVLPERWASNPPR
jgi:hemerythrin-like metal-binding protein